MTVHVTDATECLLAYVCGRYQTYSMTLPDPIYRRWRPTGSWHNKPVKIENVNRDHNCHNGDQDNKHIGIIKAYLNTHNCQLLANHCILNFQAHLHSVIDLVTVIFCAATVEPIIGSRRGFRGVLNLHLGFQCAVIVAPSQWMHSKTLLSHYIPS